MKLNIKAAVHTHTGRVRGNNEDNFYLAGHIREDVAQGEAEQSFYGGSRCFLAAVADGMGGEERGEQASLITVESLRPCPFEEIPDTASDCIRQANGKICAEIEQNGNGRMGSTLAALFIDREKAMCCNIGDSRVYLLRDGSLSQLSVDHNKARQMIELGVLTPEQAAKHPSHHELTQHLGIFEEEMIIEPDFSQTILLQPEDRFLLCSDGLTDMVTEEEITTQLSTDGKPEEQAANLVQLALEHGGRDNVTVLVVQVKEQHGPLSRLKTRLQRSKGV